RQFFPPPWIDFQSTDPRRSAGACLVVECGSWNLLENRPGAQPMPLPTAHHARRVVGSAARLRLQVACHAGAPSARFSTCEFFIGGAMDLLNLSMPWWHFVVRGALTYLTLLLLLRL